jgi:hypothetical protein
MNPTAPDHAPAGGRPSPPPREVMAVAATTRTRADINEQATRRQSGRRIGGIGTAARLLVGLVLLGSVLQGQLLAGPFRPVSWALGLVGLPAVLLGWQWWRARRGGPRFAATGAVSHALNVAVFLALYLTPWYAPALRFTSDAALLFYGTSMLLAALRGYAGCEVLAISNWLLRRDDQVGCMVFSPIDQLERHLHR